jgi:GNAT superfamily N-acetyltransferase
VTSLATESPIRIRPSRPQDFDDILVLLGQLWPGKQLNPQALREVYERGLTSQAQVYLSAVERERVIGFCSLTIKNNLWQEGNLGHVDELVVEEAHRGGGIGNMLLDRITLAAREAGCKRLELDSAFHRKPAHEFYEKKGFANRAYLFSKVL